MFPYRSAILLLLSAGLGGCSGGGSYPSLASRPAERLNDSAAPGDATPAATSAVAAAPSADLAARLRQLMDQAQSAYRDFESKRAGIDRLVSAAHGAPVGSEDWARATQALSGAQAARSLTAQPLAELDRIEVDDRLAHPQASAQNPSQAADAQTIAQTRDAIAALVAREDEVLGKLDGRLTG